MAEHTLLYPVDTVKTHIQAYCADCPVQNRSSVGTNPTVIKSTFARSAAKAKGGVTTTAGTSAAASGPQHGMLSTMRNLVNHGHSSVAAAGPRLTSGRQAASLASTSAMAAEDAAAAIAFQSTQGGVLRLWRGVQTMIVGCVPAHALYFSSYEAIKAAFLASSAESSSGEQQQNLGPVASSVAGASAALCHDLIMTPLDTVKQRMQLGHYSSMGDAIRTIVSNEGAVGLYRSFPITLLTNLPYGMVMVSTNEFLREVLKTQNGAGPSQHLDIRTTMLAGCGAGTVAAAITTPLDRVKTRLQTQRLGTAMAMQHAAATCEGAPLSGRCPKARAERALMSGELAPRYTTPTDAFRSIVREEGYAGLFRGMVPRLLTHTPAVAISWTTYEAAKRWLKANM